MVWAGGFRFPRRGSGCEHGSPGKTQQFLSASPMEDFYDSYLVSRNWLPHFVELACRYVALVSGFTYNDQKSQKEADNACVFVCGLAERLSIKQRSHQDALIVRLVHRLVVRFTLCESVSDSNAGSSVGTIRTPHVIKTWLILRALLPTINMTEMKYEDGEERAVRFHWKATHQGEIFPQKLDFFLYCDFEPQHLDLL